jgi:hypothetical protein
MFTGVLGTNNSILGWTFVLGAPSGPATYDLDATNTISIVDEAIGYTLQDDVFQTITITEVASGLGDFNLDASNTIGLTDSASGIPVVPVEDTLSLDDEASGENFGWEVRDTIVLSHSATFEEDALAEDTIGISDSHRVTGPWRVSAEDDLAGELQVSVDPETLEIIYTSTGLRDEADVVVDSVYDAENDITLLQAAVGYVLSGPGIEGDAEDTITISDAGEEPDWVDGSQTIPVSQAASGIISVPADSEIELSDSASCVGSSSDEIEDTIPLADSFTFTLIKSNTHRTYSPFVGSGPGEAIPASYTEAGATPGFRLQYPGSGTVTDELVLKAPNLGNIDRLQHTRINRETRGGTLIVYRDPIWPKIESILVSFSGLTQDEGDALLLFMDTHIGQEIRMIDWEDRLWRGVIMQPNDPVVQDSKGCRSCTASFEFEGELV